MRDGINDGPTNAVAQVAALKPGESYCRAKLIPSYGVTPDKIRLAKQRLLSALTPVVARARKRVDAEFKIHSFHNFTRDYDVVVAAMIVREPEL